MWVWGLLSGTPVPGGCRAVPCRAEPNAGPRARSGCAGRDKSECRLSMKRCGCRTRSPLRCSGGAGAGSRHHLPRQLANCSAFPRGAGGDALIAPRCALPVLKPPRGTPSPPHVPPRWGNWGWKEGEHVAPQNPLSPAQPGAAFVMSPAGEGGDDARS